MVLELFLSVIGVFFFIDGTESDHIVLGGAGAIALLFHLGDNRLEEHLTIFCFQKIIAPICNFYLDEAF